MVIIKAVNKKKKQTWFNDILKFISRVKSLGHNALIYINSKPASLKSGRKKLPQLLKLRKLNLDTVVDIG